ncbi:protein smoothened [Neocloeon triangulifer]|uniref:protein smoothened n=1 Tax=Neocloeon triangulifer TaxID=2078957 RepID=UPI00286F3015|nr:protein smoothened [Neocloeon triangulifer]XP_059469949.1 protein smoothened [Neocloeon triangulifer]
MRQTVIWCLVFCVLLDRAMAILNGTYANSEPEDSGRKRSKIRSNFCYMKTTTICENINSTSVGTAGLPPTLWCLGTKLPYTTVSLDLLPSVTSLTEMLEIVESWEVLSRIPKCWAVVQPLICAYHLPQCINDNLILPPEEMCLIAQGPCKLLKASPKGYPEFLNCSNRNIFQKDCKDNFRELKFNTTSTCPFPLVPVPPPSGITMYTDPQRHYPSIEGCSLPCETPLFSPDELERLQRLIAWGASFAVLLNLFVVLTFIVDWGSSARYPALIVFYLNLCCMISNFGWLIQFIPGARSDILCRKDGTARGAEPSMGENLSCVLVFVIVYYFLMAALVWFVVFAYSWHTSFKNAGLKKVSTDNRSAYYHLAAWSWPMVLTIITLAIGEVYPDSSSGICFVGTAGGSIWGAGSFSIFARGMLLVGPVLLASILGGFFLVRGMVMLVQIQIKSKDQVSHRAIQQIQTMVVRLAIFSIGIFSLLFLTLSSHVYEFRHAQSWQSALEESIMCRTLEKDSPCPLSSKPSLSIVQLHILAPFFLSILVASWLFNSQSKETWKRVLQKKIPCCIAPYYVDPVALNAMERHRIGDTQERPTRDINLQKHKVIARAFAKRGIFKNEGRLSFSFRSSHGDPVGMNFDMNSQPSSKGFSSSWANKLPRLMKRRGAFPKFDSASTVGRNSVESDVGMSFRQVSVESRRNSMDSQVSITISEVVARHQTRGSRSRQKHGGHSSKHHPRTRHRHRDKRSKWGSRSSQMDQVSQVEFHTSQIESSRRCSISSVDSQNPNGLNKFLQAIQLPGPSGLDNFNLRPSSRQLMQRRAALTEAPSSSLMARLQLHEDSDISDEESNSRNGEHIEMSTISAQPEHGPKIVEIVDDIPHNAKISSEDSSDESSSSSSSGSEPQILNGHYHPKRSTDSKKMNGSTMSKRNIKLKSRASRNSNKRDLDSSSSSAEEETPFLTTVAQVTASRDSAESQSDANVVTRDIGVQVSFEPETKKKSPRRRNKDLAKSFHAQTQTSDVPSKSSRSKSAGVY